MGWSIGYDEKWKRDIGYGVPAYCDHPGCEEVIDRGLAYVCCDAEPYGGEHGCGLFFCLQHNGGDSECKHEGFTPAPDHPDWMRHKLGDTSWSAWRKENPDLVAAIRAALQELADA